MEPDGHIVVANSFGVIFRVNTTNSTYANIFGGAPLSMAYGTIKLNDHEYLIADAGVHPGGMIYADEQSDTITNISESGGIGNICNSVYLGQSNQVYIANDVYFGSTPTVCLLDMTTGARNVISAGGYLGDIYDMKVYIYPDPVLFSIPRPIVAFRGLTNVANGYMTYSDQTFAFTNAPCKGRLTLLGLNPNTCTAMVHFTFADATESADVYSALTAKGINVTTNDPWLQKLDSDILLKYRLPRPSTEYYFSWDFTAWISNGIESVGYLPCELTPTKGIPTLWLDANGITNQYDQQSLIDHDRDGYETWKEFYLGTVPTNGESELNFTIGSVSGKVCLTWSTTQNRQYELQQCSSLGGDWTFVTNIATPSISTNQYLNASTNEHESFRIKVRWNDG